MAKISHKGKEVEFEFSENDYYAKDSEVEGDYAYRKVCDDMYRECYNLIKQLTHLTAKYKHLIEELAQFKDGRDEAYQMTNVLNRELARLKGEIDRLKAEPSQKVPHKGTHSKSASHRPTPKGHSGK